MDSYKNTQNSHAIEGLNLIAQGKRNLLCKEITQAVSQLAEATKILEQEFGNKSVECADAYYTYGRALLELHRSECTVLGDAIPQDEEEKEKGEDGEGEEEEGGEGEEKEEEGGENEENDDDGSRSEDLERLDRGGQKENSEEEEEEVSNLQVAWEVLELAKLIYSKLSGKEMALRLADVLFKLADVQLESELFEGSISDYVACLKLQQQHLPADSRLIAETFYQLGVAHSLLPSCKPAVDNFLLCVQTLQMRVGRLEKVVAGEEEGDESADAFYTAVERALNEMEELKELIKEIYLKIEECKDEEKEALQVSQQMLSYISPFKVTNHQPTTHITDSQPSSLIINPQLSTLIINPQPSTLITDSQPTTLIINSQLTTQINNPQPTTKSTLDNVNNITHLLRKKRKSKENYNEGSKQKIRKESNGE